MVFDRWLLAEYQILAIKATYQNRRPPENTSPIRGCILRWSFILIGGFCRHIVSRKVPGDTFGVMERDDVWPGLRARTVAPKISTDVVGAVILRWKRTRNVQREKHVRAIRFRVIP